MPGPITSSKTCRDCAHWQVWFGSRKKCASATCAAKGGPLGTMPDAAACKLFQQVQG